MNGCRTGECDCLASCCLSSNLPSSILKTHHHRPQLLSSLWGRANFCLSLATLAYSWVVGEDRQRAYNSERKQHSARVYWQACAIICKRPRFSRVPAAAEPRSQENRYLSPAEIESPDRGSQPVHTVHTSTAFDKIRTIHTKTSLYKGLLVCDFGQTAASLRVQNYRRSCKNQKNKCLHITTYINVQLIISIHNGR